MLPVVAVDLQLRLHVHKTVTCGCKRTHASPTATTNMHVCPCAGSAACLLPHLQQRLRRSFAVVSGEDSHDDFKPKYKAEPAADVNSTIENDIKSHEVFIYMKVGGHRRTSLAAAA